MPFVRLASKSITPPFEKLKAATGVLQAARGGGHTHDSRAPFGNENKNNHQKQNNTDTRAHENRLITFRNDVPINQMLFCFRR